MDLYDQRDLINEIGPFLDRFSWKSHDLGNSRCPICGDSKRKKSKKRFYFYLNEKRTGYSVKCHNCGYGTSLLNFIKSHFPDVYRKTLIKNIQDKKTVTDDTKTVITKASDKKIITAENIPWVDIRKNKEALNYLLSRKLQANDLEDIFYTDDFSELVGFFDDDHPEQYGFDERIVFPLRDHNQNLFGFQGRLFQPSRSLRYITFMRQDFHHPKMYGIHKIDPKKRVYITEGPIDSLFLPNAIASCGSDLISCKRKLREIGCEDYVFIFDNEPRNEQINQKMTQVVLADDQICILPASMSEQGKDINDYILAGFSREFILETINTHTFQGLRARVEMRGRMMI